MANLLGHRAWNRSKKCKRVNCCTRPRRSRSGQRLREEREWKGDTFEEDAPEYPEWIDRVIRYVEERISR